MLVRAVGCQTLFGGRFLLEMAIFANIVVVAHQRSYLRQITELRLLIKEVAPWKTWSRLVEHVTVGRVHGMDKLLTVKWMKIT